MIHLLNHKLLHLATISASALAVGVAATPSLAQAQTISFDIPAQSLTSALGEFSRQSNTMVLVAPELTEGKRAPALKATLPVNEAIGRLLRGSGLRAVANPRGGYRIESTRASQSRASSDTDMMSPSRADAADRRQVDQDGTYPSENASDVAEIVVTGSHIRGASVTSPVIVVSRASIANAGQNGLGEVVRSIPQNFGGGQNPGIGTGGGLANSNLISSSQLNLRGLGADATLTLLNGHRLPYDGAFAGIDISAIPVAAVERIEIVPDGASAQYGSDAVAGVANVILRRDFRGVTTSARIGAATSGGYFQQGADAVAGTGWTSGHIMLAYQFAKNDGILARQRDFAGSLPQSNSLYPTIRQHSIILSGRQTLGDGIELKVDGYFSDRRSRTFGGYIGTAGLERLTFSPTAQSFSVTPELAVELGGDWMARASVAYGESESRYNALSEPPGGAGVTTSGCYCNSALSAELLVDGPVFTLPGGDVRIGFGGGYRSNSMRYSRLRNGVALATFDVSLDSHHVFAETAIPIVSPAQHLNMLHRLTVTAAARYENYPGMGRVTTPKFGLVYEPAANVAIKASWGRSFKAPTLYQKYVGYETYLLPASAYGVAPTGTVLYTSGGNPALRPERARSWSTGVEFRPAPELRLWASYFNVHYRDRVTQPIPGSIASAFRDPGYATLLDRDPSAALLTDLIAGSLYGLTNFADEPYDPGAVAVLVDNRNRNVARQDIEGVDIGANYGFDLGGDHRLDLSGSATYLKSAQQLADTLPSSQVAGTVFNPPHWRGRAGASWHSTGFTFSAFANYIGKLTDRRFVTATTLPSALTVDVTAQIAVGAASDRPPAFDLTLVVNNLFDDRPPPIGINGSSDTPYDSTNYSPIGRFIGLKVSRTW